VGRPRLAKWAASIALLAVTTTCTPSSLPTRAARCSGWEVTPSPNRVGQSLLFGVWAGHQDVWAVGASKPSGAQAQTLIERWHGGRWELVSSPNAEGSDNYLDDVSGRNGDVWAVGQQVPTSAAGRTLVEHWDGSAWSILPSPNVGRGVNALTTVTEVSPSDVWVAGYYDRGRIHRSMVFRWNGARWLRQPLPRVRGAGDGINAIAAGPSGRVLAVGGSTTHWGTGRSMILTFDGRTWRQQSIVRPPQGSSLSGVAASPDGRAWAVGAFGGSTGDRAFAVYARGTSWSIMSHEPIGQVSEDLNDVATDGSGGAWAVGSSLSGGLYRTFVERTDGGPWSHEETPNLPHMDNRLLSVFALPGGGVWAAGTAWDGPGPARTLVLHRCPS
jgi:hypothetical protein